jgi:SnoaL-like domain
VDPDRAILDGVTNTYFDYAEYFDQGDIVRFADLFAAGCYFDRSTSPRGHDWIVKRATRLRQQLESSSHHISNIRLRSTTGSEARAAAYVYSWQRRHDGTDIEAWGRYETTFRLDRGRWRFAHHQILVLGVRGGDVSELAQAPRGPHPE